MHLARNFISRKTSLVLSQIGPSKLTTKLLTLTKDLPTSPAVMGSIWTWRIFRKLWRSMRKNGWGRYRMLSGMPLNWDCNRSKRCTNSTISISVYLPTNKSNPFGIQSTSPCLTIKIKKSYKFKSFSLTLRTNIKKCFILLNRCKLKSGSSKDKTTDWWWVQGDRAILWECVCRGS